MPRILIVECMQEISSFNPLLSGYDHFSVQRGEELYRQATRLAMADEPLIPLHHQVNIWALRKGLVFHYRMQEGLRAWDIEPQ